MALNQDGVTDKENAVIFYGSRKIDAKNLGFLAALFMIGVWLTNYSAHGGFQNGLLGGILTILMALAGLFFLLKNQITNTPCITIDSNGVTYELASRVQYKAQWDSLSAFEPLTNRKGRTPFIRALITGDNISETLRREKDFRISFLSTLNVAPEKLLEDLNRIREQSLKAISG